MDGLCDHQAVSLWHINVEHGDVRQRGLNLGERFSPIPGLGYDLKIGGHFDDLFQSLADNRMVVGNQDPDFCGHSFSPHAAILIRTMVPSPGVEWSESAPPRIFARSSSPINPKPRLVEVLTAPKVKPTPLSVIVNEIADGSRRTVTRASVA